MNFVDVVSWIALIVWVLYLIFCILVTPKWSTKETKMAKRVVSLAPKMLCVFIVGIATAYLIVYSQTLLGACLAMIFAILLLILYIIIFKKGKEHREHHEAHHVHDTDEPHGEKEYSDNEYVAIAGVSVLTLCIIVFLVYAGAAHEGGVFMDWFNSGQRRA